MKENGAKHVKREAAEKKKKKTRGQKKEVSGRHTKDLIFEKLLNLAKISK